jgi:hypothetical protein
MGRRPPSTPARLRLDSGGRRAARALDPSGRPSGSASCGVAGPLGVSARTHVESPCTPKKSHGVAGMERKECAAAGGAAVLPWQSMKRRTGWSLPKTRGRRSVSRQPRGAMREMEKHPPPTVILYAGTRSTPQVSLSYGTKRTRPSASAFGRRDPYCCRYS